MFLKILKGALAVVSAAVVIPYSIALVSNIFNGWPQGKNKYRRALHPRKVWALNYTNYRRIKDKSKFILLFLRWRRFYKKADPSKLYKNLAYGRNDCTLDVHLPHKRDPSDRKPVLLFVYGGSWSSGDKNMYGMLCSEIASFTNSIAVCPNYSTYPKGYVDDMIQDVVDCISWIVDNIQEYGGDSNKIVLMGHSAGAHLCAMAILELLHDERMSVEPSFRFQPAGDQYEDLAFAESHYGRLSSLERHREGLEDSSGSSESFAVVSENGARSEDLAASSGSASLLGSSMNSELLESSGNSEGLMTTSAASTVMVGIKEESQSLLAEQELEAMEETSLEQAGGEEKAGGDFTNFETQGKAPEVGEAGEGGTSSTHSGKAGDADDEEHEDDSGDNDSVITVRPKDIEGHATLVDLCKAVKAFIGLAGVYSIGDHFQHEFWRGVEDVSCMSRAHYGEDHFARFSPKEIIQRLGRCLSLPKIVLVHGDKDIVVPVSASAKFSEALSEISANVKVKIIPDCDHYEICLDLMDKNRRFYAHVMSIILETVKAIS